MKKYIKKLCIILIAILGVVSMNFTVVYGYSFLRMFAGRSGLPTMYGDNVALLPNYSGLALQGLLEFVFLIHIIKFNTKIEDKRMKSFVLGLAIILDICLVLGSAIMINLNTAIIWDYLLIYFIKFTGLLVILYNLILFIFNKITEYKNEEIEEKSFFTGNLKSFFVVLLILIIAWLPYFLEHFPGTLTYDSVQEVNQILGNERLTNNNPLIHIGLMYVALSIGNFFGTLLAGIVTFTILQYLITGVICSFTIYYLARKKVDVRIRFSILIFFALFPLIPIMDIVIQKDTLFAVAMLLFSIVIYEILVNYKRLFNSKLRIFFSALIIIITALARRNAIYAIVASLPFFAIYFFIKREEYKGYLVKIGLLLSISCIIVIIINNVSSRAIRTPDSWKKYIPAQYNVVIQQLLRTAIDHTNELNNEEIEIIENLFDVKKENLTEQYSPYVTDIAIGNGNSIYFKDHKTEIMKLYIKLFFRYPMSYIDTVLCTTSGYWDIEESRYSLWTEMIQNDLGIKTEPIKEIYIVKFIENIMKYQNIPLIGLIYSVALPFWILLGLITFNLYNKNYRLIMLSAPLLLYFATLFLGPLNGEVRYIFYLYMCLPLLIALTFHNMGTNQ